MFIHLLTEHKSIEKVYVAYSTQQPAITNILRHGHCSNIIIRKLHYLISIGLEQY